MAMQIIWTALPNGFDASYYYFSVFVSHRLSGGTSGTLQDYSLGPPSDPTNWAASLASGFPMLVSFDGGATFVSAERLLGGMPRFWADLAPALWTRIFPSTIPTEDFVPQKPSAYKIRTFGASSLVARYEALYADLASSSGGDYPAVTNASVVAFTTALGAFPALLSNLHAPAAGLANPPAHNDQGYAAFAQHIRDFIAARAPGSLTPAQIADAQQIAVDHYLAYRFYRRSTASQYGTRSAVAPAPVPVPSPTFHKLVGMLADHPTLLRYLGLVLDFRVAIANMPGAPLPPTGRMRMSLSAAGGGPLASSQFPFTAYRITSDGFYALENKTDDLYAGLLVLSPNNQYSVAQMDADGHAQKMIAYGITAGGWTFPAPSPISTGDAPRTGPTAPVAESLPARRTGGLTVLKQGRADALNNGVFAQGDTNNANLAANKPVTLYASDVCRGFRVDVWDANSGKSASGGPWRSLCQRGGMDVVGTTTTTNLTLPPVDAEGFVKVAGGSRGAAGGDPTENQTLYLHEAVFGWDGWSLCARRPGRAIAYHEGDGNQHPAVIGFLPNHGAAGYPVVSNYDVTPGSLPRLRFGRAYFFRARSVDLAGNGLPLGYNATTVDPATSSSSTTYLRYEPVAAPALVLLRALTPGESLETLVIRSNPDPVDALSKIRAGGNATAYAATSVAQTAGLLDHCDRHVAPPKTSQIMAETHGTLDTLMAQMAFQVSAKESGTFFDTMVWNIDTGVKEALPAGELAFVPAPGPTTPGDPPASGQYVLHQLPTLTLPYLPDPLADGLAIQPAAGSATPPIVLPYDSSAGWPRVKPLRLLVQESTTASMAFSTAPGTFTASLPPATLAIVRYSTNPSPTFMPTTVVGSTLASNPTALNMALMGGNWLLSPYRELTLVHAVQRPLLIPSFANVGIFRGLGQTFVSFTGPSAINVDGRSTVQIDINAAWTDPIDDPADPAGPTTVKHTGRAFSLAVNYGDVSVLVQPDVAGPPPPLKRHEFGDTKHRWVTYSPDATTRYREYFPTTVTSDVSQITTKGKTQILSVLASRRPDPLRVLYAVPSFKWSTSSDGLTITRTGRAVRVYFDRPWYGSGDDELVGVLLAPTDMGPVDPVVAKYTSEWGRDPVWNSFGPRDALGPQHFINRVTDTPQPPMAISVLPPPLSTGPFALAEDPNLAANVVAFKPEYNIDRKLWFVDIEMDPGDSYFPFARLALARYQPHAIGSPSQHLSRVVRTEFLQLVPDRVAAISLGTGEISVTVSGVGAHNWYAELSGVSKATSSPPSGPPVSMSGGRIPISQVPDASIGGGHRVTAQVQERPLGSDNDLLWADVGSATELASFAETGSVVWAGTVKLPTGTSAANHDHRLLIRETERHLTDADVAAGFERSILPYGERLVYAAAFPLTV